jgi:hypothetical protein
VTSIVRAILFTFRRHHDREISCDTRRHDRSGFHDRQLVLRPANT